MEVAISGAFQIQIQSKSSKGHTVAVGYRRICLQHCKIRCEKCKVPTVFMQDILSERTKTVVREGTGWEMDGLGSTANEEQIPVDMTWVVMNLAFTTRLSLMDRTRPN